MLDPNDPIPTTSSTDDRVIVGRYRSAAAARERSIVVLAVGEECWQESQTDETTGAAIHVLLVRPEAAAFLRDQLARFERESAYWPPRPPQEPPINGNRGLFPPLFWSLALVGVFRVQQTTVKFTEVWLLDTTAIWQQGEWWRAFTALWLHADVGHLVSNLVSGWFVLRTWFCLVPLWRGWGLLLGSATVANLGVAAVAFAGGHRSLGASTLVFAGLGLLTGRALRRRGQPGRWRPLLIPAAAGLTLLGLYGAGDAQTDVLAHGAGFLVGAVAGALFVEPLPKKA